MLSLLATKLILIAALAPASLACPDHNYHSLLRRAEPSDPSAAPPPAFDYLASEDWAALSPSFSTCQNGAQQAPIALSHETGFAHTHPPHLAGLNANVSGLLSNSGFGITFALAHSEGDLTTLPAMRFDDETVYLSGWHVHTPAEHVVDGHRARAEMHLVHVTQEGKPRAVLAIIMEPAQGAQVASAFWEQMRALVGFRGEVEEVGGALHGNETVASPSLSERAEGGVGQTVELQINPGLALAEVGYFDEYWTYQGSLTTPPCTEGLRFFVAGRTMTLSTEQMQAVLSAGRFSARVTQPAWNHYVNQ